jgi:hypothetical protein
VSAIFIPLLDVLFYFSSIIHVPLAAKGGKKGKK